MEEKEVELKIGSKEDMLAHASENNKETSEFDGFEGIIGLALVSALFSGKNADEIKEVMAESEKPTTLKSLEKKFKLISNSLFELFALQQKKISELDAKVDIIKKSLRK